jgi:hypothetical protein
MERMKSRWKDGLESGESMKMMMESEGTVLAKWLKGESEQQREEEEEEKKKRVAKAAGTK